MMMFGGRKGLEGLVWWEEGEGDGTTAATKGKNLPPFYVPSLLH